MHKVRRIFNPKLRPFHLLIKTYYLTRIVQRITRLRRIIRLYKCKHGQWLRYEAQLEAVDFFVSGFCYCKELVFISRFNTRDGLSV